MARRRRVRRRLNGKALLMLALAIIVVVGVIYLIVSSLGGTFSSGAQEFTRSNVTAIIVRNEQVVTTENYGSITYVADEGAFVAQGDTIAEVYQWGYNTNTLADLLTLQQEIYNYQINTLLQEVVNHELEGRNAAINEKMDQIAAVVGKQEQGDILTMERELKELLELRRKLLVTATQPDEKLTALYTAEETYMAALSAWQVSVQAKDTGMISFYFDEYETLLNKKTLAQVSMSDINAIKKGKQAAPLSSGAERSLYRIVQNNDWYIVLTTDRRDNYRMVQGETYAIDFKGFYDKTYQGTVLSAVRTDTGSMYVLSFSDDVTPFMNMRTVECSLSRSFTGLKIPLGYIREENGVDSILIKTGDTSHFVTVEVLCDDGKNALIRSSDPAVAAGVHYAK